ncbi:hypothetical protein DSO57_1019296 [Entomophthora muscae]|uniref:Uncharacterized protein n=1 Tax=Entomophthora muscae TaxID=34485 RepID=A0ACC2S678_9FUNG|nr:hypothetical protein DSO57_1019296 [Entomophthora muscae]
MPGDIFSRSILSSVDQVKQSFAWGWSSLTKLSHACLSPSDSTLLHKSRLVLLILYHKDIIEIVKLACFVSTNAPNAAVSPTPLTYEITEFSLLGLRSSIHLIQLFSFLYPAVFNLHYSSLVMTASSFILTHFECLPADAKATATHAIRIAKDNIQNCVGVSNLVFDASINLDLLIFLAQQYRICL